MNHWSAHSGRLVALMSVALFLSSALAAACGNGSAAATSGAPALSTGPSAPGATATPTPIASPSPYQSVTPGPTSTPSASATASPSITPSAASTAAASPSPTAAPGSVPLSELTPQQLAGQRVIYGYSGLTPPASLLVRIRAGEVAGVVFFKSNIASLTQIRKVIGQLQSAAARSPVKEPLLLMADQEGGIVRRLPGAPLLSEKQIGLSANPAVTARQAGHNAGLLLRSVGMNVNLAPVLDVYRAPGDFSDQYGRSYSSDPQVVARLGSSFIKAQEAAGVAATAKHFPGLGAATQAQNTDLRPVTLGVPLATLRSVDERPYRQAISAGVRLVMVSWARYAAFDPARPAGLSVAMVQNELRKRLGFGGVTITDALGAGALKSFGSIGNRAVLAARAGMDVMLCGSESQATKATDALAGALRSGTLDHSAFLRSVQRVLALRAGMAR